MFTHWLRTAMAAGMCAGFGAAALAQQPPVDGPRPPRVLLGERGDQEASSPYYIGLALDELSEELRAQLDLKHGVIIADVAPDSPAAKADIKRHDILITAGDMDVNSARDVLKAVNEAQDRELPLVVLRAGKKVKVTVTPTKRPMEARPPREQEGAGPEGRLRWPFARGEGRDALFLYHPGMIMGKGMVKFGELPEDISISIKKLGKEPAQIAVKKGDKSWEVAEDKLSDLPDEVREVVERFLAGGFSERMAFRIARPGMAPMGMPPMDPRSAEGQEAIQRAQAEVAKAQKQLEEQVRKWHEQQRPVPGRVAPGDQSTERKLDEVIEALKNLRKDVDELKKK
jgi:hypothetical protein